MSDVDFMAGSKPQLEGGLYLGGVLEFSTKKGRIQGCRIFGLGLGLKVWGGALGA